MTVRPGPVARGLAWLVRAYQAVLSPRLMASCRFEPSCSAYAHEALLTHGALRGGWLTLRRLGRCQPFAAPGLDPVPPRRTSRDPAGTTPAPASSHNEDKRREDRDGLAPAMQGPDLPMKE